MNAESPPENEVVSLEAEAVDKAIKRKVLCFIIVLGISTALSVQTACVGTHFDRSFGFIVALLLPVFLAAMAYQFALKRLTSKPVTQFAILFGFVYVLLVFWLGWNISRMSFVLHKRSDVSMLLSQRQLEQCVSLPLGISRVYPNGAIIGSYKHSPSDCSLSAEFISGGATFEAGETLLPPVKKRRRAHADGMVIKVAANCCLHRGEPEWKAFCVNTYQWSLCGMAVFEHMSRCLCGTSEFDG